MGSLSGSTERLGLGLVGEEGNVCQAHWLMDSQCWPMGGEVVGWNSPWGFQPHIWQQWEVGRTHAHHLFTSVLQTKKLRPKAGNKLPMMHSSCVAMKFQVKI